MPLGNGAQTTRRDLKQRNKKHVRTISNSNRSTTYHKLRVRSPTGAHNNIETRAKSAFLIEECTSPHHTTPHTTPCLITRRTGGPGDRSNAAGSVSAAHGHGQFRGGARWRWDGCGHEGCASRGPVLQSSAPTAAMPIVTHSEIGH